MKKPNINQKNVNPNDYSWKQGQTMPQQRYPGQLKTVGNTDILPKVIKPTLKAVNSASSKTDKEETSPLRKSNGGIKVKQLVESIKKEGSEIDYQEVDRKMEGMDLEFSINKINPNSKYVNKLLDISMHGS